MPLTIPELVAPAGNLEKQEFAYVYGADACYAGFPGLSLRAPSELSAPGALESAVKTARAYHKKIFIAANAFIHETDLAAFDNALAELAALKPDGVILSDPGAVDTVRNRCPELPVHISTQANTTNSRTVRFYERLGVKRAVLARELSIDEIKSIRDAVSMELEIFVHGAMCMAYSGRCLLSSYMTHPDIFNGRTEQKLTHPRDANAGDCAQSCRWKYSIIEECRPRDAFPLETNARGTAILSSRDLNLARRIGELSRAGVNAVKIEGRMKSLYYTAGVTRVYRRILDDLASGLNTPDEIYNELETVSHREYTEGFTFPGTQNLLPAADGYSREMVFLGRILKQTGPGQYLVEARNRTMRDDPVEAMMPDGGNTAIKPFRMTIEGTEKDVVQPNMVYTLHTDATLVPYTILRRPA